MLLNGDTGLVEQPPGTVAVIGSPINDVHPLDPGVNDEFSAFDTGNPTPTKEAAPVQVVRTVDDCVRFGVDTATQFEASAGCRPNDFAGAGLTPAEFVTNHLALFGVGFVPTVGNFSSFENLLFSSIVNCGQNTSRRYSGSSQCGVLRGGPL
jgi:hypothetical protein